MKRFIFTLCLKRALATRATIGVGIASALSAGLGLLLVVAQAHAGWTCSGRATDLTLDPTGNLYMSLQKTDNSYVWNFKPLGNVQQANSLRSHQVHPQSPTSIRRYRAVTLQS